MGDHRGHGRARACSGSSIPEEYGGAGLDYVSEALVCEEIERGEAAFRTLISVHVGLNSLSLLKYATEEQKQRYLVPQARGEKLACFGLTEPAAGSDVAAMQTTARREGDAYVLNGQKNWISYATVADHALVFAKTDPAAKHKGISAFIVERGWHGRLRRRTPSTSSASGPARPASSSSRTSRCRPRTSSARRARASRSRCTGSTRAASPSPPARRRHPRLPRGVGRVRARARDVRPADRQVPVRAGHDRRDGARLRDVEAARHAGRVDEGPGRAQHARDVARQVARHRVRVQARRTSRSRCTAPTATRPSTAIERYFRNARAPIIYEGTTQIHKMMQAEHALGYRELNGTRGDVSPLAAWGPALLAR